MKDYIPEVVWLNVSPALVRFHQPLMQALSHQYSLGCWEYVHEQDEASSLDHAIALLYHYLSSASAPVHLIGHSTSGALALRFAQQYPEWVRSLTLLSVGVHPLIDWQAHYYANRQRLPCGREMLLAQMARLMFGGWSRCASQRLVALLDEDLKTALSPHSLYRIASDQAQDLPLPLLVCRGEQDGIVTQHDFQQWQEISAGSALAQPNSASPSLWQSPQEGHFFHYFCPTQTADVIQQFWTSIDRTESAVGSLLDSNTQIQTR